MALKNSINGVLKLLPKAILKMPAEDFLIKSSDD